MISISLYLLVPDNVFEHILEVYEHFSDRNKPHKPQLAIETNQKLPQKWGKHGQNYVILPPLVIKHIYFRIFGGMLWYFYR